MYTFAYTFPRKHPDPGDPGRDNPRRRSEQTVAARSVSEALHKIPNVDRTTEKVTVEYKFGTQYQMIGTFDLNTMEQLSTGAR